MTLFVYSLEGMQLSGFQNKILISLAPWPKFIKLLEKDGVIRKRIDIC
jgi:hypothetical protein